MTLYVTEKETNMCKIEKLSEIFDSLREAWKALGPETANGNRTAGSICGHVYSVLEDMIRLEGCYIDPEDIDWACSELKKALRTLKGSNRDKVYYAEEIEAYIEKALSDLKEEKRAAAAQTV